MGTARERTKKEIMDYIRMNSENGKLTRSLLDIAKGIGYSNATVHRALRSLEEQGAIEIQTPDVPSKPNTIIYKGSKDNIDEFMSHGIQLISHIEQSAEELKGFLHEMSLRLKAGEGKKKIVRIIDMPEGNVTNIQIVTQDELIRN